MIRWMVLLLAGFIALAPGYALAQGPRPITVNIGEVFHGDLASISEPMIIVGTVDGDVTSWSGTITVLGEVHGDVVSYVGTIRLGPDARVTGSVLSLGGGVLRAEHARVAVRMLGENPLTGGVVRASTATFLQPQREGAAAAPPLPLISTAMTMIVLLLASACAAIWPRRVRGVSMALRRAPGRSLAFGLLTTFLGATLLLPLSGLIALSLVGLPLLLPFVLIVQIPYLFGLVGLGLSLGERIRPNDPQIKAAAVGVGVLLLPLSLIGAVAPRWSLALFYAATSLGLGAAILSGGGAYALRARTER
ncbi:MAG: polymer-forming cytoskeletal protein [Chloroflexales bacterium]